MAASVHSATQEEAQYRATTLDHEPHGNGSTLSRLSSELARIEGLTVAGHCDPDHAIEAVLHAIASLEQVSGVDVALAVDDEFVSVASSGVEGLAGTHDHLQVYADCIATGRLVRCEHTSRDPRVHAIPFSSMMVTPLSAHGDLIGVLAVYSTDPGVFGHDYIVPLGTAAVICSFLAPQVLEAKKQTPSHPQAEPIATTAESLHAPLVMYDRRQQNALSAESEVVLETTSPVARSADAGSTDANTRNFTAGLDQASRDRDLAQHLAREEAIRSILLKKPANEFARMSKAPSGIDAVISRLRSPLGIIALFLLLSSFVYGSMQMLRRSGAAASSPAKPAAAATRSATVTKLIGAPRPMPGNAIPADAQVTPGRLIQGRLPAYPADALGHAVQGDVTAILLVSERGAVQDVRVTGGDTLLANSVLSSLSHWRFSPFEVNGHATAVEVPVIVAFHINAETASPSK